MDESDWGVADRKAAFAYRGVREAWEAGLATLQDVAEASGYSVMTASRALSGHGYVSPRASKAVLAAAARLGYVPNGVARSLRSQKSGVIALIISDIENSFYGAIAATAEEILDRSGYRLFIGNSNEDPEKELRLLTSVLEVRAEGVLITPTAHNGEQLLSLAEGGLPVVQLDRIVEPTRCSSVLLDNEDAARQAIEYVASMGHTRIAFISGPRNLTSGEERVRGAMAAVRRVSTRPELFIVEAESYLHEDAEKAVEKALRFGPTAIIAGNNVVAEACMDVLSATALDVPSAVSLMSFDDLPWMRWVASPLTAMRQPIQEMSANATQLVLDHIESGRATTTRQFRYPAELIVRDSVASPSILS